MLRPGYVLRMGSIEGLYHLDAEAISFREEHGELGHLLAGHELDRRYW